MDTGRLANAVSRPGIDPRTWISYAAVDAVGIDTEGVFVDVELLPTREKMTARLGTIYAGPGYGFHIPVGVGDEVVVGIPNGDPMHGPTILARMQSASDELSTDAQAHSTDLVLVIKDGVSIRINVAGAGKVYLGATNAVEAAVLGTTYRAHEDTMLSSISTALAALSTLFAAQVAYITAIQAIADPTGTATTALATALGVAEGVLAATQAAISAFEAAAASYLSQKVTIG